MEVEKSKLATNVHAHPLEWKKRITDARSESHQWPFYRGRRFAGALRKSWRRRWKPGCSLPGTFFTWRTETIHEEKTKDLSGSRSEQRFDKRASVLQRELTDWRWKVGVFKVGKGESAVWICIPVTFHSLFKYLMVLLRLFIYVYIRANWSRSVVPPDHENYN